MKRLWIYSMLLGAFFVLNACGKQDDQAHQRYICPMHPTVLSDRPSACPVCGMDLVRQIQPGEEVALTADMVNTLQSPSSYVIANVPTVKPVYKQGGNVVIVEGKVVADPNDVFTISARNSGRVEYVGVNVPYQFVKKGQLLLRMYSPEFVVAQREMLVVLAQEDTQLIEASKQKLRVMGASENDIDVLIQEKKVQNYFSIHAPYDGYVILNEQVAESRKEEASKGMGSMNNNSSTAKSTTVANFVPKIGEMVQVGDVLFTVSRYNRKRAEFPILTKEGATVRISDTLHIVDKHSNNTISTISEITPSMEEKSDFFLLRSVLPIKFQTTIGDVIRAEVKQSLNGTFWLPKSAVMDMGTQHIVWVKQDRGFVAKVVTVGERVGDQIQILAGLSSASEVAKQAHFLVDSESLIEIL